MPASYSLAPNCEDFSHCYRTREADNETRELRPEENVILCLRGTGNEGEESIKSDTRFYNVLTLPENLMVLKNKYSLAPAALDKI